MCDIRSAVSSTDSIAAASIAAAPEVTDKSVIPAVIPAAIPDVKDRDETDDLHEPDNEITNDFWQEILNHTKSDPSLYPLISNSSEVQARQQDNELIINVSHPLTASTIRSSGLLEEAVKKALNKDVRIRVEEVT